jgi:uncharacterized glyoxalase superfamily protein PhnB
VSNPTPWKRPDLRTVTPYLIFSRTEEAFNLYARAFGGTVRHCHKTEDGMVYHAEMIIGDSIIMGADENEEWSQTSPL